MRGGQGTCKREVEREGLETMGDIRKDVAGGGNGEKKGGMRKNENKMKPNDTVSSISELPIVVVAKGYMKHDLAIAKEK